MLSAAAALQQLLPRSDANLAMCSAMGACARTAVEAAPLSPAVNRAIGAALKGYLSKPSNDMCDSCRLAVYELSAILKSPV